MALKKTAVDSTGLECTSASGYFVRRHRADLAWKTVLYHRYPKLGVVCDTSGHFILSIRVSRGPHGGAVSIRGFLERLQRTADVLERSVALHAGLCGLEQFISSYSSQTNLLMAAAVLFTLPIVILFFFAQRTFIRGIATSGLKG